MRKVLTLLVMMILPVILQYIPVVSGQEWGPIYLRMVDEDQRPLPDIRVTLRRWDPEEGWWDWVDSERTNSSGVAEMYMDSSEFGNLSVLVEDMFHQELTLNQTTINVTGFHQVFTLECTDSRFVNVVVTDSLTGVAPPICAFLDVEEDYAYLYDETISFHGNISLVAKEGARELTLGSPLRRSVKVELPIIGDLKENVTLSPAMNVSVDIIDDNEIEVRVQWQDVEIWDRGRTLENIMPYAVSLTLIKEGGYFRKKVELGTFTLVESAGEKRWRYQVNQDWENSTAISNVYVDLDYRNISRREIKRYENPWLEYEIFFNFNLLEVVRSLGVVSLREKYALLQAEYTELETDYNSLNSTYHGLLINYTQLQAEFEDLKTTYHTLLSHCTQLNSTYHSLLSEYAQLQADYKELNSSYSDLQANYESLNSTHTTVVSDYNKLKNDYHSLHTNYKELQSDYDSFASNYTTLQNQYNNLKSTYEFANHPLGNTINLMYIFIATTIVSIATTIYFAKRKSMS